MLTVSKLHEASYTSSGLCRTCAKVGGQIQTTMVWNVSDFVALASFIQMNVQVAVFADSYPVKQHGNYHRISAKVQEISMG